MNRIDHDRIRTTFCLFAFLMLVAAANPGLAEPGRGLGPRLALSQGPDELAIGVQFESRHFLGPARFAPSFDLGLGDANVATANIDLRWYLLPLPETGILFYGAAGPAWTISPDSAIGLSLVAGASIPMKNQRRYNLEARFGLGDAPDFKIALGLVFDI